MGADKIAEWQSTIQKVALLEEVSFLFSLLGAIGDTDEA